MDSLQIQRIWALTDAGYKLYDPAVPQASDLAPSDVTTWLAATGAIVPPTAPSFTPGHYLTQDYWDYTKGSLQRLGLLALLARWNVKEIVAVPETDWCTTLDTTGTAVPTASGGIVQYKRRIILKDAVGIYTHRDILAAAIMHEAYHMRQMDAGFFDGFSRNELQAYTVSDIIHQLLGGDVPVFSGSSPYPTAIALAGKDWQ